MKNFLSHLLLSSLLLCMVISFTGCGGDSPQDPDKPNNEKPNPDDPNPDTPEESLPAVALSFTSLTFTNDGDNFACPIYGLTAGEWSAESNQSWCTVKTAGNILKIDVEPNPGAYNRTATISIILSDKKDVGSITVEQRNLAIDDKLDVTSSSKSSFLPIFTATWCPFCPDMDRTIGEIQKRWSAPILPMNIHIMGSELYTPLSVELSELYDNNAAPIGYFENYFKVSNAGDENANVDAFWNAILANTNANGYTNACSALGCKSSMSDEYINAEISIKPKSAAEYRLQVFILEDGIIAPQMSYSEGEISDYRHDDVLVGAMTPVKGQEFYLTAAQKTVNLSCKVPEGVVSSNLRLLVVLQRNIPALNYSDNCWFADNCISVPLGRLGGNGSIENIFVGEEIDN